MNYLFCNHVTSIKVYKKIYLFVTWEIHIQKNVFYSVITPSKNETLRETVQW